jgi:hypothetical protein
MREATMTPNPIAGLIAWFRAYSDRRSRVAEIDNCCTADLQRIAADVRVSPSELRTLAAKDPDSANLLYRRMAILHLDPETLARDELGVLRDLQRNCSLCESRRRCVADLAKGARGSGWEDYCPNTMTLCALVAERPQPPDLNGMIEYLNTVGAPLQRDAE